VSAVARNVGQCVRRCDHRDRTILAESRGLENDKLQHSGASQVSCILERFYGTRLFVALNDVFRKLGKKM
jgi:hypothetical protein